MDMENGAKPKTDEVLSDEIATAKTMDDIVESLQPAAADVFNDVMACLEKIIIPDRMVKRLYMASAFLQIIAKFIYSVAGGEQDDWETLNVISLNAAAVFLRNHPEAEKQLTDSLWIALGQSTAGTGSAD